MARTISIVVPSFAEMPVVNIRKPEDLTALCEACGQTREKTLDEAGEEFAGWLWSNACGGYVDAVRKKLNSLADE